MSNKQEASIAETFLGLSIFTIFAGAVIWFDAAIANSFINGTVPEDIEIENIVIAAAGVNLVGGCVAWIGLETAKGRA
jgi:hypothetical protein